jgi:putative heme degradation protein
MDAKTVVLDEMALGGNYEAAAEMGIEALVTTGTTAAVNKTMKHVKKIAKLTKNQEAVHDSAFGLFVNVMKNIFISPLIKL